MKYFLVSIFILFGNIFQVLSHVGIKFKPYATGKKLANEMSSTLDTLLDESVYNKEVRPFFGVKPVEVEVNFEILSLGPVDEVSQAFFVDCYFRQYWTDERLVFNTSGLLELSLDWKILNLIWKPDTFFINGRKSKLHKITVPNRFSRIQPDGQVSYSQRLTIHASCPMKLIKFPLDSQVCPLLIGSYGYPAGDLIYSWKKNPLNMKPVEMSQFTLNNWTHGAVVNVTNRKLASGFRTDSILYLKFLFERQTGYFLLQIYTPLFLMVFCSWVAFWIVKTDVPGRCGLGITTVLSVAKIGFVGGAGKPMVPYATALDTFVIICFVSVFASLIEFAVINFISIFISRLKKAEETEKENLEKLKQEIEGKKKLLRDLMMKNKIEKPEQQKPKREDEDIGHEEEESLEGGQETSEGRKRKEDNLSKRGEVFNKFKLFWSRPKQKAPLAESELTYIDEGSDVVQASNSNGSSSTLTEEIAPQNLYSKIYLAKYVKSPSPEDEDPSHDRVRPKRSKWEKFQNVLVLQLTRLVSYFHIKPIHQMLIYQDLDMALELIDSYSRRYFPLTFIVLMFLYWMTYLFWMPDPNPI